MLHFRRDEVTVLYGKCLSINAHNGGDYVQKEGGKYILKQGSIAKNCLVKVTPCHKFKTISL